MNENLSFLVEVGKRYESSFSFVFVRFCWQIPMGSRKILFVVFLTSLIASDCVNISIQAKIFCLSVASFSHPATCYLARARGTHINLRYTQWPRTRNNKFYKRKLVFQSILFIFLSLVSVFTGFLYESLCLCWFRVPTRSEHFSKT